VGCVEGRFEGRFALALCFGRVAFCLNAETAEALRLERRARGRRSRGWRYCFVRVAFCLNAEIGFGFWILNFGLGSHWVVQFKRDLLFKRGVSYVMAWRAVCYECFLRRNDCYAILAPIGLFNLNGIYCLNAEAAEALRLERRARGAAKPIR
jgi:hypothetical protein